MIELTDEQCTAVKNGEPVVVRFPEAGEDVIVVAAKHLASIREALADQREQEAVLRFSMKQAAKVAKENPY